MREKREKGDGDEREIERERLTIELGKKVFFFLFEKI